MNTLLITLLLTAAVAEPVTQPASRVKIVLVGDSTVTDTAGWGAGFAKLVSPEVELVNLSRGGRSSKSFRAEGRWDAVATLKPDYVLIQFGHNDQPGKGPERETDPNTTFRQNMRQYVIDARAMGATPVLVTSLTRRRFQPDGRIQSDLIPYAEATRAVAAEMGTPLIELHDRSIEFCEALGKEGCDRDLAPRKENGDFDGTHLTAHGSDLIAPLVARELLRVVPGLSPYIRTEIPEDRR